MRCNSFCMFFFLLNNYAAQIMNSPFPVSADYNCWNKFDCIIKMFRYVTFCCFDFFISQQQYCVLWQQAEVKPLSRSISPLTSHKGAHWTTAYYLREIPPSIASSHRLTVNLAVLRRAWTKCKSLSVGPKVLVAQKCGGDRAFQQMLHTWIFNKHTFLNALKYSRWLHWSFTVR